MQNGIVNSKLWSVLALCVILIILPACTEEDIPTTTSGDPLPLLPAGTHYAIVKPPAYPEAEPTLAAAFTDCITAGVDSYESTIRWDELETSPGVIDTSELSAQLDILQALGLKIYLTVRTIDTNNLALPSDLLDPSDPRKLADGRHFDDPVILDRYNAVLDAVVPVLLNHGGFFLSVGNEVNIYLDTHSEEITPFANFVAAARKHVAGIDPDLAVGAALTFNAIEVSSPCLNPILNVVDVACFTYYPLNSDMSVRDPSVVNGDINSIIATIGEKPLLLQEVGYPAGYEPVPTNGSSLEKQRQFVENLFVAVGQHSQIRFVSVDLLSDLTDELLEEFVAYYGFPDPMFREYLATLGIRRNDGSAKPAYNEFLNGLEGLK